MARTLLTASPTQQLGNDDGLELFSFTQSESRNITVSISGTRFANLSNFTIEATALAANGTATGPTGPAQGAAATTIDVIDTTNTDNEFQLRFVASALASNHPNTTQLAPGAPLWYYISCTISTGTGTAEEAWEIVRGHIQIVDSISV